MSGRGRGVVCTLVAAALIAACGGGGGGAATPASPIGTAAFDATSADALIVDGEVDADVLDAMVAEFAALDEAAQSDRVNELAVEFERQLYEAVGLAASLGSAAAVDESITEAATWMAGLGIEVSDAVATASLEPQGFRSTPTQTEPPNIGQGLFGGLLVAMLGGEGAVSSTNDGSTAEGELAKGIRIKATKEAVELTTTHSFTDSKGVTTKLDTRNVNAPCPKPDGTFEASATIDTSSTIDNGATGSRGTFDVTVKGTVDDNAELVGYDTTYRGQYADFVASRGGFIDVGGTRPSSGAGTFVVNRGGGTITDEIVVNAVKLGQFVSILVADRLVKAATMGWESGRCVTLVPTVSVGPKGLDPSASVTITAAPRSKMDNGPVGGNVTAVLAGGGASVAPSQTKVPADATFTYTAPGEKNETGTVALESRSKRGVAKATIDFDTKQAGYTASGGSGVSFSGTVADLAAPFTLAGVGNGFTVEFSFTPSDSTAGSLSYTGSGGGAELNGSGTYSIAGTEPGPLTLTYNAEGCASVGGCRATSNAITLTPIDS